MKKNNKNYKGLVQIDATKEIYQLCEISVNKKEMILSVIGPTMLSLV
ncbi:MAG: hypothetical protein HKN52_07660 [Eudoraea sp.]|nr:hypothetical protein [Muriicola sp.]NNE03026.1 hypothetical protein [Eudoraea sp.]